MNDVRADDGAIAGERQCSSNRRKRLHKKQPEKRYAVIFPESVLREKKLSGVVDFILSIDEEVLAMMLGNVLVCRKCRKPEKHFTDQEPAGFSFLYLEHQGELKRNDDGGPHHPLP